MSNDRYDRTMARLINTAFDLRSEDGENSEYDRALVEVVMRMCGWDEDERSTVERMLGIKRPHLPTFLAGGKTIACRCGWNSGACERQVDATIAYQVHVGDRQPDGSVNPPAGVA